MIKKVYYEFWPYDRELDTTVIIESPSLEHIRKTDRQYLLADLLSERDIYYGDFRPNITHSTLESATARERGCKHNISNNVLTYTEIDGGNMMKYCTLENYIKNYEVYVRLGGGEISSVKKMITIPYKETILFLNKRNIHFSMVVCPEGFDGCVCRECKAPKYMAEPDGILNDGMFTCYTCIGKLKSYLAWPYSKEKLLELQELQKKELENV